MFVVAQIVLNANFGCHFYYLLSSGEYKFGFVRSMNENILLQNIDCPRLKNFKNTEKITIYEKGNKHIISKSTPEKHKFIKNGKEVEAYFTKPKINDGHASVLRHDLKDDDVCLQIGLNFSQEDVDIANQVVDMGKECNISAQEIRDNLLLGQKPMKSGLINNVTVQMLDVYVSFKISVDNIDQEQKYLEQILLPKFEWSFGGALQIFPFSYVVGSRVKNITKKYILLNVFVWFEIFGINLSVDLHYIIRTILYFLLKEVEKKDQSLKMSDIPGNIINSVNRDNIFNIIEFLFLTFRIVEFTIKYGAMRYQILFDNGVRRPGFGCEYQLYSKVNSLSL